MARLPHRREDGEDIPWLQGTKWGPWTKEERLRGLQWEDTMSKKIQRQRRRWECLSLCTTNWPRFSLPIWSLGYMKMNVTIFLYLGVTLISAWASQVALVVKNPPAIAGDRRDVGLISGWGRSHGGGHGNPIQYCLENSLDRVAWQAIVHRVAKSPNVALTSHSFSQSLRYLCILHLYSHHQTP